MLAVAKTPRIRVQIKGMGADVVAALLKKNVPGISILADDDTEPVRGSEWFEKMEAEVTPGRSLRVYRDNAGLVQRELAARSGIPVPHISAMEHDKRPIGKLNARRLAAVLGCDYRRFL